jgi:hypothetical protein
MIWTTRRVKFLRKVARRAGRFPQLGDPRSGVIVSVSPLFRHIEHPTAPSEENGFKLSARSSPRLEQRLDQESR